MRDSCQVEGLESSLSPATSDIVRDKRLNVRAQEESEIVALRLRSKALTATHESVQSLALHNVQWLKHVGVQGLQSLSQLMRIDCHQERGVLRPSRGN